jgi:mono/diheme cytochrome c family protein
MSGCGSLTFKVLVVRKMGRAVLMAAFALSFMSLAGAAYGQGRSAGAASGKSAGEDAAKGGDAARGKYLVQAVAMCGQCHTPRDASGNLDMSRWLQGAPVPWAPSVPNTNWPLVAPRIGGNPPASDADMVKLLTTGIWTTGKPLRFPMMPFRMSQQDAKAVVAYLKTVGAQD